MGITTARSEKKDKQIAHRKERRLVKAMLSSDCLCEDLPDRRAVSNVYTWAKDGKQKIRPDDARSMRK
ncbi:MAG TPA: hypothetical protein V6D08_10935 [Candidatus Obscuribacterales bacterium]